MQNLKRNVEIMWHVHPSLQSINLLTSVREGWINKALILRDTSLLTASRWWGGGADQATVQRRKRLFVWQQLGFTLMLVCWQGQTGQWCCQLLWHIFTHGDDFKKLTAGKVPLDSLPFFQTLVSALLLLREELEQIRIIALILWQQSKMTTEKY